MGPFLTIRQVFLGSPFYGVILGNGLDVVLYLPHAVCLGSTQWAIVISVLFALYLRPGMY